MYDKCDIWLENAERTERAGASLASSLYHIPVDILLRGELGAGKTTFLRGFASGFGTREPVTSPTFALEQRYPSSRGELLHLDLYRLSAGQARPLLAASDDHEGIRCIEWPERLETDLSKTFPRAITVRLTEEGMGRRLHASFDDVPIPSPDLIAAWRRDVMLPPHIIAHCHAVAGFCETITDSLRTQGTIVRSQALRAAAELHDLLRIVDLHEEAAAAFLRERGFEAIAEIVAVHGLRLPSPSRATIEQKLLFYADKRVKEDQVVTLEERFRDFEERYGQHEQAPIARQWYEEAKIVEKELFPAS